MTENYLIEKSLAKIRYTANWMGIYLEKHEGIFAKYHLLYIFNFIWMNLDLSGSYWWFINGAVRGESFTSLTYVAPCITISTLADIKSICFVIYDKQVHELLNTLRSLESRGNKREKTKEKTDIVARDVKFLHKVLKFLGVINWILIVSFGLMPFSQMAYNYMNTKEFNLLLPLLVLYPFNAFDIKVWPFIYVHQMWSTIIVVIESASADFIFFICSTYIRIQYKLLAYEFERIVPRSENGMLSASDEEFKDKIQGLVKWHRELYHCVELLEVIYSRSTLLNFISSSVIICLTGFNVTTITDFAFVVSFVIFLFMSLLQIYFLCLFGDMLMKASVQVSDAVYSCKWYLAEAKAVKTLHMIQTRAQKPCKVTALGFADVNLRSFTRILSTAWSYFALLKTVYSSKRINS